MERSHNNQQLTLEEAIQRVEGYFEGKSGELDQEIASFQKLGEGVRIEAGKIIRPELSIEALQRVKAEMNETRTYFLSILKRLPPNSKEKPE